MKYYIQQVYLSVFEFFLFFRDSYTRNLIPYFTQHFKESYYYWQDYDQRIVDSIKPDVVVVSKVERYF